MATHRCSHSAALIADRWTDDLRLSDLSRVLYVPSVQARCGRAAGFQLEGRTEGDDGVQVGWCEIN
jgi:hypothetical protein